MVKEKSVSRIEVDLLEAKNWFIKTYDAETAASTEKMQMLILYRISQVQNSLSEIRHQTRMHWTS